MFHSKVEHLERQLATFNEERALKGKLPYDYLIPYLKLDKAVKPKNTTDADRNTPDDKNDSQYAEVSRLDDADLNNTLRNTLRFFVFIRSTISELYALLGKCNMATPYRLAFRYTHSGNYLTMRDEEMNQLKAIIAEYQYKFGLREFCSAMQRNMKVRMKTDLFRDKVGVVLNWSDKGLSPRLTIGIPAFSDELLIELNDVDTSEVELIGGGIDEMFTPHFLNVAGDNMIRILRQRVRHQETEATRFDNRERLNTYRNMLQILGYTDRRTSLHVTALMLLNASLESHAGMKSELVKTAKSMLPSLDHPTSDEETFLLAALFAATRKGIYRKTVKDYVRQTNVTLHHLKALVPVLKEIATR